MKYAKALSLPIARLRSVTIAQWESECISPSVLSVARVVIAQWENKCISPSVLSVAQIMIAEWANECISLPVRSVARVVIAQWANGCISLTVLSVAQAVIAQWENQCISQSSPWLSLSSQSWQSISREVSFADHGHLERSGTPPSRHKPIEKIWGTRSNASLSALLLTINLIFPNKPRAYRMAMCLYKVVLDGCGGKWLF